MKMLRARGWVISGDTTGYILGLPLEKFYIGIVENQMEKKMENEMESMVI